MRLTREHGLVLVLIGLMAVASYAPVAAGEDLVPEGRAFSGFLLNPLDGNTYLAKMRQGMEGGWTFRLDYASDPGEGVFLYPFYLALGHLAERVNADLVDTFHAARLVMLIFMLIASHLFLSRFVHSNSARWIALGLVFIGAGQGWLGLALGIEGSDLLIPESIPFLAAYVNAHFPLAIGLILVSVLLVFADNHPAIWRALGAFIAGVTLAWVLPFSCLSLVLALASWMVWDLAPRFKNSGWRTWLNNNHDRLIACLGLALGMGPVLIYELWVATQHPVISAWTLQNQTPSPAPLSYIFGFGIIMLLALTSVRSILRSSSSEERFMFAWMISGLISLYLPIGLQRRLSLGLFFPMAALAGLAWDKWFQGRRAHILMAILLLAVSVPSNLIVVGAGLHAARSGQPLVTFPAVEKTAYEWMLENLPPGAVVLCSPDVGNRLPAYTYARVLYGHPFETPQANRQIQLVEELFSFSGSAEYGIKDLLANEVDYVFYGPSEREIGQPTWLGLLDPIYEGAGVTVYEVSPP